MNYSSKNIIYLYFNKSIQTFIVKNIIIYSKSLLLKISSYIKN